MKLKLKLMAAAVALAASAGANATIASGSNGELFFTLWDTGADLSSEADDRAYVRDLGFGSLTNSGVVGGLMNNWTSSVTTSTAPTAANLLFGTTGTALTADKQGIGTIFSVAADANLASFLAASTDTSRLSWNIAANDNFNNKRFLTTAGSISASPVYNQFRNFALNTDIFLANGPNAVGTGLGSNESVILSGSNAAIKFWGNNVAGANAAFTSAAGLGDSLGFFVLSEHVSTGETTTVTSVQQFKADANTAMQWTLATNGDLIYAAVPEPSEYALMLAGLGMIGFMARRRLNNRA